MNEVSCRSACGSRAIRVALVGWILALVFAGDAGLAEEVVAGTSAEEAPRLVDPDALKTEGNAPEILRAPGLSKGVDAIIAQIRKREVDLVVREQNVAERERAVAELETLLERRVVELDRIRQEVEDRIAAWSSQGQDRVMQLANVYSAMPPPKAGALLGKLDLDLAVSVLREMKKKKSAAVLSAMQPDRALRLSRRLLRPLDPQTDPPAAPRS